MAFVQLSSLALTLSLHQHRSLAGKELVKPFAVGDQVLVRRNAGPAKQKDPYIAVASVCAVQGYSYKLKWATQGPTQRDMPGELSAHYYNHHKLAPVPPNVSVSDLKYLLLRTNMNDGEEVWDVESILGRRKGL